MVSLAGVHSKVLVYNYVIHSVWDCSFQGQLAGDKFHQLRDMGSWPSMRSRWWPWDIGQVPFFHVYCISMQKKKNEVNIPPSSPNKLWPIYRFTVNNGSFS